MILCKCHMCLRTSRGLRERVFKRKRSRIVIGRHLLTGVEHWLNRVEYIALQPFFVPCKRRKPRGWCVTKSHSYFHTCSVIAFENIHTYPEEGHWKFQGGRRVSNAKIFKRKYETKLEFPEGWGLKPKIPSVRGVWIFSVTIHSHTTVLRSASFKLVPYLFSIFMFS